MEKNDFSKSMEFIAQFNNREACREIHAVLSNIIVKWKEENPGIRKDELPLAQGDGLPFNNVSTKVLRKAKLKKTGHISCETVTLTSSDVNLVIDFSSSLHDNSGGRKTHSSCLPTDIHPLNVAPPDNLDKTVILGKQNSADGGLEQHAVTEESTDVPPNLPNEDLEKTIILQSAQVVKNEINVPGTVERDGADDGGGESGWDENDLEQTVIIRSEKKYSDKELHRGQAVDVTPDYGGEESNWDENDLEQTVIIRSEKKYSDKELHRGQAVDATPDYGGEELSREMRHQGGEANGTDADWDDKDFDKTVMISSQDIQGAQGAIDPEKAGGVPGDEKKDEGRKILDEWDEGSMDMTMIFRTDEDKK